MARVNTFVPRHYPSVVPFDTSRRTVVEGAVEQRGEDRANARGGVISTIGSIKERYIRCHHVHYP